MPELHRHFKPMRPRTARFGGIPDPCGAAPCDLANRRRRALMPTLSPSGALGGLGARWSDAASLARRKDGALRGREALSKLFPRLFFQTF